jgi:phosphoadenosine phosphosulfate reductase
MPAVRPSIDVDALNVELESTAPETILRWAFTTFGDDAILTCSFQHDGIVLAHMLQQIAPQIRVVFINTGFHFAETLAYRDRIVAALPIHTFVELQPIVPRDEFARTYGLDLYARDPDRCCQINKVEPLRRYLRDVGCWMNGRRRDQSSVRQVLRVVEVYRDGLYKVNPLVNWTGRDSYEYLERHGIPLHPLFERGYASIGCEPCTRPVLAGEDERDGRWAGSDKTECGIHTFLEPKDA